MNDVKKVRVLFIDDEPASLTAFKSVFRDYYDIKLAASAEEGYQIMQQEHIDIVISDQRMPGISGVEFLHRIRIEFPETVRMLITGYSDIDAVVQSINGSSVSYYFSKPYDDKEMRAILDNTVEKIKLMKENKTLLEKLQRIVKELTAQKESLEQEIVRRQEAEKELTSSREKAEESSRMKSSLMANLNHEFRTPMNSILGFSDMIKQSPVEDTVKEMAGMINTSGNRLFKTLNAIVDLARFEADRQLPVIEEVSLTDLTLRIVQDFEYLATRKNLILETSIQAGVCSRFNNSFATLIITNLIDNAIKFSAEGTIRITLFTSSSDGKERAVLKIKDPGIGIQETFRQRVFEDFRQASEGVGRSYEGLGIGLSLTKKILNRLNGIISFESEVGAGTEFMVQFPEYEIVEKEPVTGPVNISKTDSFAKWPARPERKDGKISILSVEDNENNQELIALYLGKNYQLEKVYDGEQAISAAAQRHFDLILMDINLGAGIDGLQAMQKIREINGYKTIPVIAVTGYTTSEDKHRLLDSGFDNFIPKPFNRHNLISVIKTCLNE